MRVIDHIPPTLADAVDLDATLAPVGDDCPVGSRPWDACACAGDRWQRVGVHWHLRTADVYGSEQPVYRHVGIAHTPDEVWSWYVGRAAELYPAASGDWQRQILYATDDDARMVARHMLGVGSGLWRPLRLSDARVVALHAQPVIYAGHAGERHHDPHVQMCDRGCRP
ncbi:hypothetical protein C3Y87_10565 [Carbonactinospora thermoautotrophica]|uniref:hypothetical protein n=1 Tax=Carbonactinospora thermoautotrophica TaxID=1469144 RepID=UPI00226EC6B4|nr:hypothetical protein [Carbonactinospora thermoautotrophica]MCX9191849.1 hypothetical protein [Carbonactinospora thermoautotrophica]